MNDFDVGHHTPVPQGLRDLGGGVAVVDLDDDVVLAVAGVVTAAATVKMLVPSRITASTMTASTATAAAAAIRRRLGAGGPDSFQLAHPVPGVIDLHRFGALGIGLRS